MRPNAGEMCTRTTRAVLKGHRLDAPAYGIVEPPLKVLTYCLILGVEDEPAVPVGHRLGELLGRLLARLAVDSPALGAGGHLNMARAGVPGSVPPVLTLCLAMVGG
jgi:hypothetical protein